MGVRVSSEIGVRRHALTVAVEGSRQDHADAILVIHEHRTGANEDPPLQWAVALFALRPNYLGTWFFRKDTEVGEPEPIMTSLRFPSYLHEPVGGDLSNACDIYGAP